MSKIKVSMSAGAQIGNKIYLSAIGINGLFEYSIDEDKLKFLMPFLEENSVYAAHCGAIVHGDEIWFVPQHGKKIAVYKVKEKEINYIEPKHKISLQHSGNQHSAITHVYGVYDEFLYVLPSSINALNIINMDTRDVSTIYDVIQKDERIFYGIYHDGKIHAFTSDGKWRIEIVARTGEVNRYKWNYGVIADVVWQENIDGFVVGKNGSAAIAIFDEKFNLVEQKSFMDKELFNGYMKQDGDVIWMFPWNSKKIIKMDTNTWERECVDLEPAGNSALRMHVLDSDHCVAGVSTTDGLLFYFDNIDNQWHKRFLESSGKEIIHEYKKYNFDLCRIFCQGTDTCLYEKNIGLDTFIEYIK